MLYDFSCNSCFKVFEVSRPLSDTSAVVCPKCASTDTKKVFLTTPQIEVSWKRALGLGHSGQLSMSPAKNKNLRRELHNKEKQHVKSKVV